MPQGNYRMAFSGIRFFIEELRKQGDLLSISTPLDPKFEISAVLSEIGKKEAPAIFFEKVKGYPVPVVGNLLGTKRRLSMALGTDPEHLFKEVLSRLEKRIPPALISDSYREEVTIIKGKINLTKLLPILTHYEKDSGPYITSGITSSRDPRDGTTGRGLHRMEVRGKDRLGISLLNPPLAEIYAHCKKKGMKMEVATVIGMDPLILISSILKAPIGTDKLSLAGALKGGPIPLIKAKTVDIDIPQAEVKIEGYIDPKGEEKDGVLGESSGYYMGFPKSPTIHVTALTYQAKAVYHSIIPWSLEVDNLLYLVHGLDFFPKMKKELSCVREIHLIPGTFGSHVVMSLETDDRGEVRKALTLALSFTHVKKAIAVNTDVNVHDDQEVEWALATRFQADRDLIVITDLRGQPIDPSSREGFRTTKIGIDATRPQKEGFEKVDIPGGVKIRLAPIIKKLKQGK
jgi:2,5-furandicarboxylate decarboxylase 1